MSPRGTRAAHAVAGTGAAMDGGTYGYVQEVEPVLVSRCWCDGVAVLVPRDEVLQGLTRSCGWASCHGPAGEIVRGTHAPLAWQGTTRPLTAEERETWAPRFAVETADRRDRICRLLAAGVEDPFALALHLGGVSYGTVTADLAALREAGRVIVVGPRLRTKRGPRPK